MGDRRAFMDVFFEEYMKDEESPDRQEQDLLDLYESLSGVEQSVMNEIFIILTGFSFETLCDIAGIE
jgi:hypothetical protein